MLILRNKNFARLDYAGLSESGKKLLHDIRNNAAKELKTKKIKLAGVKDKRFKEALQETYLTGAKYRAEVARKAAEMI